MLHKSFLRFDFVLKAPSCGANCGCFFKENPDYAQLLFNKRFLKDTNFAQYIDVA